jgi:hypothetical protein
MDPRPDLLDAIAAFAILAGLIGRQHPIPD